MSRGAILLVEDDAILALHLRDILVANGYAVAGILARGEEVAPFVAATPVDLILMDIDLAGAMSGIDAARKTDRDVVILDTAGRLAIDEEMMAEVAKVAEVTTPHQIYLVLDAMTGQDAVATAKAFNERLELDGVILTKFVSDTRGGAALSV